MQLYPILRRKGWGSPGPLQDAAMRSSRVGNDEIAYDVRRIRSQVLDEGDGSLGTVCVYEATSSRALREHASRADLPAGEIVAIADTVVVRPRPAAGYPVNGARLTRAPRTRTAHGALPAAACAALAPAGGIADPSDSALTDRARRGDRRRVRGAVSDIRRALLLTAAALVCCAPVARAAPGDITTVAGTTPGFGGDGGPAIAAQLNAPTAVALAPDGGFLIADAGNQRIRKVLPDGRIVTVAGTGVRGFLGDGGSARNAQLNTPVGVSAAGDGGFFIADTDNHAVRKVLPDSTIVTVAGTPGARGYTGDTGPATSAKLAYPNGVAETADGGFLIADTENHCIRKVFQNGTIVTVAGTGAAGYSGDGGPAIAAQLDAPNSVAPSLDGGFLIADTANNRIRRVFANGTIVTVAGTGGAGLAGDGGLATSALIHAPEGVAPTPDGGFLIADSSNDRIRRVSPAGIITTVAGTTRGFSGDDGPAVAARLELPYAVAVTAGGGALIADYDDARIRAVEGAALGGGPAPSAAPVTPVAPARAPAFGARTNVSLSLTHARIRAGASLSVTVRNANTFAISGSLTARARNRRKVIALATKRFAVAAHGATRVTLALKPRLRARLARTGRLTVAVTATVTDPAGHRRRATATLTVKLAHAHRPAYRK